MADLSPYIGPGLGAIGIVTGWLCKQAIENGKDIRELKTAFRFYLEHTGLDAAKILCGSQNPTPPEMAQLLARYPDALEERERAYLRVWLIEVMNNETLPKGERSFALQLLAAMDTIGRLTKPKVADH